MTTNTRYRRVLAIKTRAIGDTVLMTGVLRLLRKHRPAWELHALVTTQAGPLLENLPFIDRVIAVNEPKGVASRVSYWMKMLRRLRDIHYDQVLNFHASFRTAFVSQMLRAELCVVNDHDLHSKNRFSDLPVPNRGRVKAIIDRDLDVLRAIGITASIEDAMPELRPYPYEIEQARALLGGEKKDREFIFLGIGASRATKRWPPDSFVGLVEMIARKRAGFFVITSIPGDKKWLDQFLHLAGEKKLLDRIVHLADLPIRTVMAVISCCQIYIGNDSGLKHVAASVGVPTFTFFGPEAPEEWHPYPLDRHKYSFIEDLKCRTEGGKHWCFIEECTAHGHQCMREVRPDRVVDEILFLLG